MVYTMYNVLVRYELFTSEHPSPTTIFPQMYLGHALLVPSATIKYLGIHINKISKKEFDKYISTLKFLNLKYSSFT